MEIPGLPAPVQAQVQPRIDRYLHRAKQATFVAAAGLASIGAYEVWQHIPDVPHFPNIDLFPKEPATGNANIHPKTYKTQEVDIHCSDEVTAEAGVYAKDSLTPFGLSTGSVVVNKLVPVSWLECGEAGISTVANVTYVGGKATNVVVPLSNYRPTEPRVDTLNAIMCLPLQSTASIGEMNKDLAEFKLSEEAGHPENCLSNSEEGATGVISTGGTAGTASELAMDLAVIAGTVDPLPPKIESKVLANAKQQALDYEQAQFPGATVEVKMPLPQSDLQQTLTGWNTIRNEVNTDFDHKVSFSESGGMTVLNIKSGSANGKVYLHEKLNRKQLSVLNKDA